MTVAPASAMLWYPLATEACRRGIARWTGIVTETTAIGGHWSGIEAMTGAVTATEIDTMMTAAAMTTVIVTVTVTVIVIVIMTVTVTVTVIARDVAALAAAEAEAEIDGTGGSLSALRVKGRFPLFLCG